MSCNARRATSCNVVQRRLLHVRVLGGLRCQTWRSDDTSKHLQEAFIASTCFNMFQHVSTCFDMFQHVSSLFRSSVPALKRARPVISNRAFFHSAIHLSRVRRAVAEPVCTTQPPGFGSGSSSHCEEGNPGDVRNSKTSKAK